MDLNYDKIIEGLNKIHMDFQDLRFGEVLQNAIDRKKNCNNANMNDMSSKEILSAVNDFYEYTKKVRNSGN
jgi:hypothetical protein